MAIHTTNQFPYALEPGLRAIWNESMAEYREEDIVPRLYGVERTNLKTNTSFGISALGDVQERAEGAPLPMDAREQLWKKTWTQRSFDKGIAVTAEMLRYGEYNQLARQVTNLATTMFRTRQKHAAETFENAFTTAGFDGVSLCNAAHPDTPAGTSTQSNAGSTALSYNAVVATIKLMRRFTNAAGAPLTIIPDTLLVPIELQDVALTIRGSILKPGGSDNDINFVRDNYQLKVITSPFLTDTNNWFLIDSRLAKMHNIWLESDAPTVGFAPEEEHYRTSVFAGHMAYDYGYDDWRWVYGHAV